MTSFIFGEAMLEYHTHGGNGLRYGGDTLNTAIHMARAGQDVAYVTAVGTDPISDALVAAWAAEGIDTRYVLRHPDRTPGIYAIHLDEHGERSFLYWRERSAARRMFELTEMADTLKAARQAELVYFSLISLAVIGEAGTDKLLDLAKARKDARLTTAYDSNYRPNLWSVTGQASTVSQRAIESVTLGLPTNVDECALRGVAMSETDIAGAWHHSGCSTVIVKAGAHGCLISEAGETMHNCPARAVDVVDTSGAGDSFNAGFLIAFLEGKSLTEAAENGHNHASKTLGHFGAISL